MIKKKKPENSLSSQSLKRLLPGPLLCTRVLPIPFQLMGLQALSSVTGTLQRLHFAHFRRSRTVLALIEEGRGDRFHWWLEVRPSLWIMPHSYQTSGKPNGDFKFDSGIVKSFVPPSSDGCHTPCCVMKTAKAFFPWKRLSSKCL